MNKNIIQNLINNNYLFDPIRNIYSLDKYLINHSGYNIMYGVDCYTGKYYENYKNIIIDLEEPNFLFLHTNDVTSKLDYVKTLYKKLTLCPYSAKLFNSLTKLNNVKSCFFPVDNEYLVNILGQPDYNKLFDVLYIGNNISSFTEYCLKFNPKNLNIPTYIDKIKALYNSKIAICHNVLFCHNHLNMYLNAIHHFPELNNDKLELPQLKSRIFEAGFSKCIPLVYFDKSKIIEQFFEPNVDFIYFYNTDELNVLINKILNNYNSYKFIAENIYKKCNDNYKLEDFINIYIL
jgi:hypothetical protein